MKCTTLVTTDFRLFKLAVGVSLNKQSPQTKWKENCTIFLKCSYVKKRSYFIKDNEVIKTLPNNVRGYFQTGDNFTLSAQ